MSLWFLVYIQQILTMASLLPCFDTQLWFVTYLGSAGGGGGSVQWKISPICMWLFPDHLFTRVFVSDGAKRWQILQQVRFPVCSTVRQWRKPSLKACSILGCAACFYICNAASRQGFLRTQQDKLLWDGCTTSDRWGDVCSGQFPGMINCQPRKSFSEWIPSSTDRKNSDKWPPAN